MYVQVAFRGQFMICMAILTKAISDLSATKIYAADATDSVYPLTVFLFAVVADGAEVAKLCMAGRKCHCCTESELDKTDISIQIRSGTEVSKQ